MNWIISLHTYWITRLVNSKTGHESWISVTKRYSAHDLLHTNIGITKYCPFTVVFFQSIFIHCHEYPYLWILLTQNYPNLGFQKLSLKITLLPIFRTKIMSVHELILLQGINHLLGGPEKLSNCTIFNHLATYSRSNAQYGQKISF